MKNYAFIDYATQGYNALVALLILFLHDRTVSHWELLVSGHLALMVLTHGLLKAHAARPDSKCLSFLRHFYPVLLYTAFYRETGVLNRMAVGDYLDPFFIRLEHRLFGSQPSLRFMDSLPWLGVSEVFYAAYFSYYIMIAGVGLALFFRSRAQFFHYVSVVSAIFYVCYVTYIFTPVMGPRVFFRAIEGYQLPDAEQALAGSAEVPAAVQRGLFYRIMAIVYSTFEAPGAAFPSSHVAIAVATCCFSFRYLRPVRYVHATFVTLLCLSTVYCRYHYLVDVIAGLLTAAVLLPLADRLYWRCASSAEGTPTPAEAK